MHHLGVPMNEHLIKQDTNYAEIMTQAKKRRTACISPRMGPPKCTLDHYFQQVPLDRSRTDPSSGTAEVPSLQIDSRPSDLSTSQLQMALPVQAISSGSEAMDDPIAADQAEQQEVWTPDIMDYDFILRKAHALMLQPSSQQSDHWNWIITADFSNVSSLMHLSNMIATLYPAFPVKLTGGRYTSLLADNSMVRFLETRCVLCDLSFQQSSDLFLHHNLVHGCIPDWSLKHFHIGIACLHKHLRTLDLPHLTDQEILQLGQIIILRLHCAQLVGHGNRWGFPADGGHLGTCSAQGSAEENLGDGTSRNRETPQGQEVSGQEETGQTQLIKAMAALLLRHEDSIKCLNLDMEYMVHLNQGPGSILGSLMTASKEWTNASAQEKTAPLRHHLVVTMIDLLLQRFTALTEAKPESELHQRALHYLLLDSNNNCPFLCWSPEKKQLIQSKTPPLPLEEVFKTIQEIKTCLEDSWVTLKFHSLRKMSTETDKAVPFLWTVSHRVAPNLWHLLQRLAFHSSWQLIQVHLRPANLQRSPLAKSIQQHLGKPWDCVSTATDWTAMPTAVVWGWLGWAKS